MHLYSLDYSVTDHSRGSFNASISIVEREPSNMCMGIDVKHVEVSAQV
jgi:hypothetical protein